MTNGIYLSINNDTEGFRLPVNPEKIEVTMKGSGEEFKIAKLGSVNVPKDVELQEFTIESFLPGQKYAFSTSGQQQPKFYIDKIKKWHEERTSVRYIYANGAFTINLLTTIEEFTYDEQFGSNDVNFSLHLKQYKPFGIQKMKIKKSPSTNKPVAVKKKTPPRQNPKPRYKTYSLVKGDSLWKVAEKFLGSGTRYPEIAKLNNIKKSDYRRLPIGLKIKLPPK
ncbi:LysM peptidoglycan-binding domain-containing protein [Mesobacillus stamsii]|uniref:LysM repeat protein n=1 Tax=Mesobacillus stamsii TaxID=225347 RepID=A0ABU0FS29_9BACI|nr:LysM domain-containing protein [Mesobacillus stamsii]MDQ0412729.1 LysM repeat protein [Mesobacillus stamsii]